MSRIDRLGEILDGYEGREEPEEKDNPENNSVWRTILSRLEDFEQAKLHSFQPETKESIMRLYGAIKEIWEKEEYADRKETYTTAFYTFLLKQISGYEEADIRGHCEKSIKSVKETFNLK